MNFKEFEGTALPRLVAETHLQQLLKVSAPEVSLNIPVIKSKVQSQDSVAQVNTVAWKCQTFQKQVQTEK